MAEIIRMPRMSDTMEEGNIVTWHKNEGDSVEAGETLAEIETDKATMDFDSPTDGVLLHIAVKEGPVLIGGVIAVIGKPGEDWKSQLEASGASSASPVSEPASVSTPMANTVLVAQESNGEENRLKASPLARNIAKDSGIDLNQVKGSGDHGRIVKKDIEAFLRTDKPVVTAAPVASATPKVTVAPTGSSGYHEEKVSQMRKVIAKRLSESKFSAPHFYLTMEIDMEKTTQMRQKVNEVAPAKISFNDFIIKAVSIALQQHPAVNASWQTDTIRYNQAVNIGVAVAIEDGLLVPVIKNADIKTLSQINKEVKEYAGRAKDRKLQPEEMQGNTFTISNLGMFGIEEFTAIINPPDACILAVGAIIEKPVVKGKEIVIGSMMKVTLSCDHRVVDGATGAKFLQTFKEILENPVRLLV